jgi:hypothetical protein
LVSFLLAVVGALLLLLSLAGIALGLFMAFDNRTREPGLYFALWWTPAVAAAGGVLMGDMATFAIGAFCFVIAGAAFALERRGARRSAGSKRRSASNAEKPPISEGAKRRPSAKTEQLSERAKRWLSERPQTRK